MLAELCLKPSLRYSVKLHSQKQFELNVLHCANPV